MEGGSGGVTEGARRGDSEGGDPTLLEGAGQPLPNEKSAGFHKVESVGISGGGEHRRYQKGIAQAIHEGASRRNGREGARGGQSHHQIREGKRLVWRQR